MNILHLFFSFNNGGAENLVVDILNNWKNNNDRLFLVIVNNNYDCKLLRKIDNEVTIIKLGRNSGELKFAKMSVLARIIKENKIDIIHCHNNNVFKYALPVIAISKGKVILTIHNLSIYKELSFVDIFLQKIFIHRITAISNAVRESVLCRGIQPNKVSVVYNGLDVAKYKSHKNKKEKFRIICVGRMVPQIKGQDILIKAMQVVAKQRKDIECVFVGGNCAEYDYISEMRNLAKKINVEEYVTFLGNRNDVPDILAECDLMVVPSRSEGFGLVVIEGMFAKLPVIASNEGGPAELIKNGETGYLVPCGDWDALGKKILLVLDSDYSDVVEKAYVYAKDNYSVINTVNNMRSVYLS